MKTLLGLSAGWRTTTILLSLPIAFFATATLAILFSAFSLVVTSSADKLIRSTAGENQLFSTPPPASGVLGEKTVSAEARPSILREFLSSYHSPLTPYSDLILQVSAQDGLDWRLLTAIAGAESTFGRNIIDDSYNAWGWGINSQGTLKFSSWEEGIRTVAKGLGENFVGQGLTTVDQIMAKYAPVSLAAGGSWARSVNYFMDQLDRAAYHQQ